MPEPDRLESLPAPLLRRLLAIALPMVISQASDTIMMFTDRLFLSRLGEAYLSAAMSGGLTSFMVSSFFVGTVGYTNAVVAQLYGAGRRAGCAQATVQGLLLALLCYPLILGLSPLARFLFVVAGQSPLQVSLGYEYFRYLIFGSVFLVLRYALSGFFLGIGRTRVVMLANLAGMLVNLPANYALIYGRLGFPALGLKGAALGTILGSACSLLILLAAYLNRPNRLEFATHRAFRFRGDMMRTLVRFGVPAGVEMLLNVAAFNLFVQFMHSYGTAVAAAVTIAFNWDIVAFIPMLGMSFATTSLVGQFVGAGDFRSARRAAWLSLRVAWLYSGTMVVVFLAAAGALVRIFASGFAGDAEQISRLAVTLIRLASIYTLADSAQLVFTGALRGAGDTRWVMRVSVGLHWAFTAAAILAIRFLRVQPVAAWIGFIVFVVLLGISMFLRFRRGRWTEIRMLS